MGYQSFKLAVIIFVLATCTNCSTIRMNYEGKVDVNDGRHATYKLAKSYDIGGPHATMCALTAIFLGGYCWYYMAMPTTQQEALLQEDVDARLNKALSSKGYKIVSSKIDRVSWSQEDEDSKITFGGKAEVPSPKEETH